MSKRGVVNVMQAVSVDDFIAAMQVVKSAVNVMSDDVAFLPSKVSAIKLAVESAAQVASARSDRKSVKALNSAIDEAISLSLATASVVKSCSTFSSETVDSFSDLGAIQLAWDSTEIAEAAEKAERSVSTALDIALSCKSVLKSFNDVDDSINDEILYAREVLDDVIASLDSVLGSLQRLWNGD